MTYTCFSCSIDIYEKSQFLACFKFIEDRDYVSSPPELSTVPCIQEDECLLNDSFKYQTSQG